MEYYDSTSRPLKGSMLVRPPLGDKPGPRFYNDSGEEVPPCAIMAVTGLQTMPNGEIVPKIAKPSTTFFREYIVNGGMPVGVSKPGVYQTGPYVRVVYDTGTPANGEGWGPKPGQWTVSKNYPQTCLVAGDYDSTNKIMLARLGVINLVIGKLDGALSQGGSATVSIWAGAAGSEADTGVNITACDWFLTSGADDIPSGSKVQCRCVNGVWYVTLPGEWDSQSVVTAWQYNNTTEDIEAKTRTLLGVWLGAESAWTKVDDTEECCEVT